MEYRKLGSSGLKVSVVGMGTHQFGGKVDQAGVNEIISTAINHGINFILKSHLLHFFNMTITLVFMRLPKDAGASLSRKAHQLGKTDKQRDLVPED